VVVTDHSSVAEDGAVEDLVEAVADLVVEVLAGLVVEALGAGEPEGAGEGTGSRD